MYLTSRLEGRRGGSAYLYEKHSADFLWTIRAFYRERWVETYSFYALPEGANEELHAALERMEALGHVDRGETSAV